MLGAARELRLRGRMSVCLACLDGVLRMVSST